MEQGSREQSTVPPATATTTTTNTTTTTTTTTATEEEEGKKNKKVKLLLCYEHLEDNVRASTKAYHWYSIDPNEKLDSTADSPHHIHSVLPKMIADHRSHFGCCALDSKIYVVGGLRLDEWEDKVENPKKEMVQAEYSCLNLDDIDMSKGFPSWSWGESEDEEKVTGSDPYVLPIPKEELKAEEESKQEQVLKEEEEEFKRLKEKEQFSVILELLNEVEFYDPSDDNYDVWHEEPPKYYAKPVVFSDVLVCDLNSSPREWNKAISMITVRSHPQVIPVDGKIYISGSSFDALIPEAKPWAEVFNPSKGTCESLEDPPIVAESKKFSSFHPSYDIQTLPSPCLALKHLTFHNKIALYITTNTLGSIYYSFSTDTESWDQPPSIPPLFDGSFQYFKNYVVVDQTLYAFHLGNLFFFKLDQKDSASHQIHGLEEFTKSIGYGLDQKPSFFFHLGDQDFCLVWGVQYFGDLRLSSPCELIRCLKFHISQEEKTQDRIAVMDMCNYYLADGFELIACLQSCEESDLQEENGRTPTRELAPN